MNPSEYYRIGIAAELTGVKRTTIASAIERGELPAEVLGCTLPVVRLEDVKAWGKVKRKRGPKPKAPKRRGKK